MNRCLSCKAIETISPGGENTPKGWKCRFCIDREAGNASMTLYSSDELRALGFSDALIEEVLGMRRLRLQTLNEFLASVINPERRETLH